MTKYKENKLVADSTGVVKEEGKMQHAVKHCSAAARRQGGHWVALSRAHAEARSSFPLIIRYCLHRNIINLHSFILILVNSKRESIPIIKNCSIFWCVITLRTRFWPLNHMSLSYEPWWITVRRAWHSSRPYLHGLKKKSSVINPGVPGPPLEDAPSYTSLYL